jgi:hypothetical protein
MSDYINLANLLARAAGLTHAVGYKYFDSQFDGDYKYCGSGIRFNRLHPDPMVWDIHKDDADEAVRRVKEARQKENERMFSHMKVM